VAAAGTRAVAHVHHLLRFTRGVVDKREHGQSEHRGLRWLRQLNSNPAPWIFPNVNPVCNLNPVAFCFLHGFPIYLILTPRQSDLFPR
jgi:hypothetical protein